MQISLQQEPALKHKISIIEELDRHVGSRNKHSVIENRAIHLVAALANLCEQINSTYPSDEAADLIRRLQRALLSNDEKKFTRKIAEHKQRDQGKL